jgi:hypothetical protein
MVFVKTNAHKVHKVNLSHSIKIGWVIPTLFYLRRDFELNLRAYTVTIKIIDG